MTTRPGYISDGAENWIQIGPAVPVGSTVYYQTSAPASPQTGDIWIDADGDVPSIDNSQFLRWKKTVSGGETSLSGNDDSGLSLEYTPAYEQVYLNGVLLVRGSDYTATTGTSITGLTALAANDVVEVFGVVARTVGDVYTQAQTNSLLDAKSNVSSTGLVLITSATIGSAVSSVTVNDCFSSSYDIYRVTINNTISSVGSDIRSTLGSTTANYYSVLNGWRFANGAWTNYVDNGASWFIGNATTTYSSMSFDIFSPYLSKKTLYTGLMTGSVGSGLVGGYQDSTTSFTGFTVTPSSGTLTGGTIKVYGYK